MSEAAETLFAECRAVLENRLQGRLDSLESCPAVLLEVMRTAASSRQVETTEALRELLERLLAINPDKPSRKSTGCFYTPYYIVDYIVSQTVAPLLEKASAHVGQMHSQGQTGDALLEPYLSLRVLDAAAGTGRFLTSAARSISRAIADDPRLGLSMGSAEIFRLVVSNCIYGVDIDAAALEAAALVLRAEADGAGDVNSEIRQHLRVGNALTSRSPGSATAPGPIDSFDWQAEFPGVFNRKPAGFDTVVGNPPWLSFSGRESSSIDKDLRKSLYTAWPSARGWPSSHGIFLELATRVCRPGGMIGQIVPEQVLDLPRYRSARESILAKAEVVSTPVKVDENAFDGVTSPAAILILRRTDRKPLQQRLLRAGAILTSSGCRGFPEDTSLLQGVVEKMRRFLPLPQTSFGDPGVHTGNSASLLVRNMPGEDAKPMRIGRDIARYCALPPSRWLVTEPVSQEDSYFRIAPMQRYQNARILVRQTAAFPIAARHTESTYFRNSLLACYGAPGFSVEYLLAILNSRLVRFFHQFQHRDGRQRAFPQVKVCHLRAIPVPHPTEADSKHVCQLEKLAVHVEDLLRDGRGAQCEDEQIDDLILNLYNVTDQERQAVESFLQTPA